MEQTFDWTGTLSAPQEFPIEVYKGSLISDNYTQGFKNWSVINTGWGNPGGTIIAGPDEKTVPHRLELVWLSFMENKFYEGNFNLPKEKIESLFKEGFTNSVTNKKSSYNTVIVGLAPKGTVVVWLKGDGNQIEVERFQAHETRIDPETISSNDSYMFDSGYVPAVLQDTMIFTKEIKEKIDTNAPSLDLYEKLRKEYEWKPSIANPENKKVSFFAFEMANGEKESHSTSENLKMNKRALPYLFFIKWEDVSGQKYSGWVALTKDKEYWKKYKNGGISKLPLDFEQSEIRKTIEDKIDPKSSFEISIEPKEDTAEVAVFILQDTKKIALNEVIAIIGKI